MTGTPNY